MAFKYPIIYCPWLKTHGMAVFPFILVKHKNMAYNSTLIYHERIHLRQQLEMLVIPFYFFYFLNYIINLAVYLNHHKAYMSIVFEKEAYINDKNKNYISERNFWAFLSYFNQKNL